MARDNVRQIRKTFPHSPEPCIERLLDAAQRGQLLGVAFVGILDGERFIADTCGEASEDLAATLQMLRVLEAKIARRLLAQRNK